MITCKECEKNFRVITNTHLKKHDLTIDQYKEKYPNVEMESNATSVARKDSRSKVDQTKRVKRWRKSFTETRLKKFPWPSERQQQIILGTLMGDGYIHSYKGSEYQSNYLEVYHSFEQVDYLKWKIEELKSLGANYNEWTKYWKEYQREYTRYWMITAAHPYFQQMRKLFYRERRKIVTEEILNQLEPLAIAVWYMDDGHTFKKSYTGEIYTQSFTFEENFLIVKWFKDRWSVDCKRGKDNNKQPKIVLSKEGRERLFEIIEPHVTIQCMKYKVGEA